MNNNTAIYTKSQYETFLNNYWNGSKDNLLSFSRQLHSSMSEDDDDDDDDDDYDDDDDNDEEMSGQNSFVNDTQLLNFIDNYGIGSDADDEDDEDDDNNNGARLRFDFGVDARDGNQDSGDESDSQSDGSDSGDDDRVGNFAARNEEFIPADFRRIVSVNVYLFCINNVA